MREFLSVPEAGELLGVGRARAYVLAASGALPTVRMGRRLLVPRRALDALTDAAIRRALDVAGLPSGDDGHAAA